MDREDEIAIENAAVSKHSRDREQAEFDARKAELPRALEQDAQERWRWFGRLIARVARRLGS